MLGYTRQMDFGPAIGYGTDGKPDFWIEDARRSWARTARSTLRSGRRRRCGEGRSTHAALALGAESLHEPRLWPEYHPGYFGAFVRDPDGNNVEAVFHGANT